jgi:hypothetical protein
MRLTYTDAAEGHVEEVYDTTVPKELEKLERKFERLMARPGVAAYVVTKKDGKSVGDEIETIDPAAEEILITSPVAGG